ncbi:MAG: sigma-70 family RNA polymerase sigma factor [Clostridia bacterium]|nr:sigma-70 family RNA polymerase sigma factor [Oscillospiraceae bacterium]MBQ6702276.1 sigma-70 family RNA polymerase sigma factor [Clostridia bacterium]
MQNDNITLIKKAQEGDKSALEQLISQNMGLVKKIVLRFKDRGCEYDDLVQIGTIGMIKAVKSFDFSFNTVFSTYAVPLIIGEIRRHLRDDGLIKVSRTVKKNGIDILRKKEEFEKNNSREPSISELAELCSLSKEDIVTALDALSPVRSLQEPLSNDETATLGNIIKDEECEIDKLTERLALKEALKTLPYEQQQIIYLRYYKDLSQQQTGDILGLTQVKVSREEKRIMNFLRNAL